MCLAGRGVLIALAGAVLGACGGSLSAPVVQPQPAVSASARAPAPVDAAPPPGAAAANGALGGTIVSAADGTPLARARVVLTSTVLSEARVEISGSDGTYRFDRLPAASYSVSATRSGYVAREHRQSIRPDQALSGIDFALEPAGVIAGRILDEDHHPFAGADVRALASRTVNGQPALVTMAAALTDDRGEFRLTGLGAGQYYVSAFDPAFAHAGDETGPLRYTPTYHPGVPFADQAARVTVIPGLEPPRVAFSLKILRPARVSGTLTTEDHRQLISGAVIMMPIRGQGLPAAAPQDVTIRPDGSFSFRNVPPGRYQIRARGATEPGGASLCATFNLRVDGRDVAGASLVLLPGATVNGVVAADAGRKLPSFTGLRVRAPFVDGNMFGDALAGDVLPDGSFALHGVMRGTHAIRVEGLPEPWVVKSVSYRGQDITDAGIEAEAGQRFGDVRITVTDAASDVSGTVRDARGAAAADALVAIIPLAQQFWTPTSRRVALVRTDAGGRYRVRGLPEGEYRAAAALGLDESDAHRPGLLRDLADAGLPLTIDSMDRRVLDLPVLPMAVRQRTSSR